MKHIQFIKLTLYKTIFTGNPLAWSWTRMVLTERDMLLIARELNNQKRHLYFLQTLLIIKCMYVFFTPMLEVPICGHATIAAHYVRCS